VCHTNELYSHLDTCRNYTRIDCNILDTAGKVNCLFSYFLSFFMFYVLREKIVLVQKFLLIQSSFVSLAPLTNASLIEQLLYYAELVVKHIII